MGQALSSLLYGVLEKPTTSCIMATCCAIWFYMQKRSIAPRQVGLSYKTSVRGHLWRIITSTFTHSGVIHLLFNMNSLWSLGDIERLGHMGLGVQFYLHYTLVLIVASGVLDLAMYHVLIHKFNKERFRSVTAVGYSGVLFGLETILAVKAYPSSKLELFGFLSLPISSELFRALVVASIIMRDASFVGHLSGIVAGYSIAWGLINGMNNYWAFTMLGWVVLVFMLSLKKSGAYDFRFIDIQSVTNPSLSSLKVLK